MDAKARRPQRPRRPRDSRSRTSARRGPRSSQRLRPRLRREFRETGPVPRRPRPHVSWATRAQASLTPWARAASKWAQHIEQCRHAHAADKDVGASHPTTSGCAVPAEASGLPAALVARSPATPDTRGERRRQRQADAARSDTNRGPSTRWGWRRDTDRRGPCKPAPSGTPIGVIPAPGQKPPGQSSAVLLPLRWRGVRLKAVTRPMVADGMRDWQRPTLLRLAGSSTWWRNGERSPTQRPT